MDGMDELVREFLVESAENLDSLDRDLVELEKDPRSPQLLARIFRAVHSLKGTGGVLGFSRLESVAHRGESLLSRMRDGALHLSPEITSALLAMADALRCYLKDIENTGQEGESEFEEVKKVLSDLLDGQTATPRGPATSSSTFIEIGIASAGPASLATDPPTQIAPAEPVSAEPASRDHKLLGEILVESAAASSESIVGALKEQAHGDGRKLGQILLDRGEADPSAVLEALNAQGESRLSTAAGNIRVDVSLLDKVMDLVGELVLARNQILQFTSGQKDPTFLSTAQRLNLITTELQEGVMKTRMQPIGNVWNRFPRLVRDLALSFGKNVRLELEGSATELDKTIIEAVKDPLTQVSRTQEMSASKLDSLQKADPQQLSKFLEREHPQTIALILAHLDAKQASALLTKLPEQTRAEAVLRLAQLRQFSPEIAQKLSVALHKRLQALGEQSRRAYAGLKGVADLLNRLDPEAGKNILESMEQSDAKLAAQVRNLMFTFEDFLSVTEAGLRELLSQLDKKTLALCLKSASEDLKTHFFKCMSSRAVEMLKEDMEALGLVRSREVLKAQQEAVAVARKLEAAGKIVLKLEAEDELVV